MGKPPVSRAALRGPFPETKTHNQNDDDEVRLFKLFGPTLHLSDLLHRWLSSATAGSILSPPTSEGAESGARYDHARDFLHRLLRKTDRKFTRAELPGGQASVADGLIERNT